MQEKAKQLGLWGPLPPRSRLSCDPSPSVDELGPLIRVGRYLSSEPRQNDSLCATPKLRINCLLEPPTPWELLVLISKAEMLRQETAGSLTKRVSSTRSHHCLQWLPSQMNPLGSQSWLSRWSSVLHSCFHLPAPANQER